MFVNSLKQHFMKSQAFTGSRLENYMTGKQKTEGRPPPVTDRVKGYIDPLLISTHF